MYTDHCRRRHTVNLHEKGGVIWFERVIFCEFAKNALNTKTEKKILVLFFRAGVCSRISLQLALTNLVFKGIFVMSSTKCQH